MASPKNTSGGIGFGAIVLIALAILGAAKGGAFDDLLDRGETAIPPVVEALVTPSAEPEPGNAPVAEAPDPEPATPAPAESAPPPAAEEPAKSTVDVGTSLALLDTLDIKGRAPKTGYDRDARFGPAWADVDRNGCDTRNDILARDLTEVTYKAGTKDCVVLTGVLDDPYTGKTIAFQRGQDTSTAVQIDHVVALMDAWQKGAQQWDDTTRKEFANDPLNLRAADGPANSAKGAADAATWLPPNKAFRCEYVAAQVDVKAKYGLWVTQAEHDAIAEVLDAC